MNVSILGFKQDSGRSVPGVGKSQEHFADAFIIWGTRWRSCLSTAVRAERSRVGFVKAGGRAV